MNTTYKPVDREFLEMLAAAKARGVTWMRLAEMTKKPVVELEVITWREPKAWAKACKYAEKLVHHEMLSEMLAQLRVPMNDNVNNARSKSQIANSVVRVIQLQHSLRTPKKTKKDKLRPLAEPLPTPPTPIPAPPAVDESTANRPTPIVAKPVASAGPLATVAVLLLLLVGALIWWRGSPLKASEVPVTVVTVATVAMLGESEGDSPLVGQSCGQTTATTSQAVKNPHHEAKGFRGGALSNQLSGEWVGDRLRWESPTDARVTACCVGQSWGRAAVGPSRVGDSPSRVAVEPLDAALC